MDKIRSLLWRFSRWRVTRIKEIVAGRNLKFYGTPIISSVPGSIIKIGDRVVLCSDSRYTALGVKQPVVLRTLTEKATISIGADSGLSGAAICSALHISIGNGCLFGANVTVTDTDFHNVVSSTRRYEPVDWERYSRPVNIGDNVFIGANSIILKGVSIGSNTVVGAGSVVTRSLPANIVAVGNPAIPIRELNLGSTTTSSLIEGLS